MMNHNLSLLYDNVFICSLSSLKTEEKTTREGRFRWIKHCLLKDACNVHNPTKLCIKSAPYFHQKSANHVLNFVLWCSIDSSQKENQKMLFLQKNSRFDAKLAPNLMPICLIQHQKSGYSAPLQKIDANKALKCITKFIMSLKCITVQNDRAKIRQINNIDFLSEVSTHTNL